MTYSTWIKTSDDLPPKLRNQYSGEVLTFSESEEIRVSAYNYNSKKWYSRCRDSCGCCDSYDPYILYWMPLPEEPINKGD
jgi:hypothetical protein